MQTFAHPHNRTLRIQGVMSGPEGALAAGDTVFVSDEQHVQKM